MNIYPLVKKQFIRMEALGEIADERDQMRYSTAGGMPCCGYSSLAPQRDFLYACELKKQCLIPFHPLSAAKFRDCVWDRPFLGKEIAFFGWTVQKPDPAFLKKESR